MTIRFTVLGSGSRGNATAIPLGRGRCASGDGGGESVGGDAGENVGGSVGGRPALLLVDAGLSPRMTNKRLAAFGWSCEQVTDILLTHLDRDHFAPGWAAVAAKRGIRVHVHTRHRNRAVWCGLDGRCIEMFGDDDEVVIGGGGEEDVGDAAIRAQPYLMAHDSLGTVGYVLEADGVRLGFATDLGRVTEGLLGHLSGVDALAIESNYDRGMQETSDRPVFLKRRIMGGAGHLSNEQSLEAVLEIARDVELTHVTPLHLSQQCNRPELITRMYAERAPELLDRLTMTNQHRATPLLEVVCARKRETATVAERNGTSGASAGHQHMLF